MATSSTSSKKQKHYIELNGTKDNISNTIKNRMHRYVNIAKAIFRKGYTSNGRTFNITFASRGDKVLAIGINDYTKLMPEYSKNLKTAYKKYGDDNYHPCIHSEMSAVLKLGSDNCEGLSFFNIRLDRNSHCCNSQPCRNCFRILNMVGVKHIYYYDDDMNICKI